jgi:SAM-dependent methyltransferase
MSPPRTDDLRAFEEALWIVLGEAPLPGQRRALLSRLIGSPELQSIRDAWTRGVTSLPSTSERSDDAEFVHLAYQCVLGRAADDGGLRHYSAALAAGESRAGVLRALFLSEEFERRYRGVPQDTQLCELANPAKWDNEEWLGILRELGLSDDKLSMHRKPYEFAQLVYGCRRLGALRPDASVVSIGAGHELILFWLANHVARVVATDRYSGEWQVLQGREGNPDILNHPERYAPFPYRREHLMFMKMDGRHVALRSGVFDIAYSLSSIEHFGGIAGAKATMREMARVLKPGGLLVVATEYVLHGPPHDETFQPSEIAELIDEPGLELVQPIDEAVYRRYRYEPVDLYNNPYQTPHMVVRFNETVFTTVMMFLRKK